jgi:hypothetical protein
VRFNWGANVRIHCCYAPVCKHLLLEARQRCREIFVAEAQRGDGKRFAVRSDEKLTAFVELERAIYEFVVSLISRVQCESSVPLCPSAQSTARTYLPVAPEPDGCDCSCWACSCPPLAVWTFEAPVFALPVSPSSTQLPPRWLPVFDGTHTICFPLFAPALFTPALVPAQAVARTRTSPTKPIRSNFVFIVDDPTSS